MGYKSTEIKDNFYTRCHINRTSSFFECYLNFFGKRIKLTGELRAEREILAFQQCVTVTLNIFIKCSSCFVSAFVCSSSGFVLILHTWRHKQRKPNENEKGKK